MKWKLLKDSMHDVFHPGWSCVSNMIVINLKIVFQKKDFQYRKYGVSEVFVIETDLCQKQKMMMVQVCTLREWSQKLLLLDRIIILMKSDVPCTWRYKCEGVRQENH